MNRYCLSRQAEQDLEDIWFYIAQNDEVAADLLNRQNSGQISYAGKVS